MRSGCALLPTILALSHHTSGLIASRPTKQWESRLKASTSNSATETAMVTLKKVLRQEYVSFFDPMVTEYYAPEVRFNDPMTSLAGVESYQKNVDMLASRTLMGSLLFKDAAIALHRIEGGDVNSDGSVSELTTTWTLVLTAKILPWSPTACFTGVSVYKVEKGGPMGVQITNQSDFWDSINIKENSGGQYGEVSKGLAVADFLNQLKPGSFAATQAGAELPYELLRRGDGYEVRRYPSFNAIETKYERRDDAFATLGSFASGIGLKPLAPSLIYVDATGKTMMWPVSFAMPREEQPPLDNLKENNDACRMVKLPARVIAVRSFSSASVEPVVRQEDQTLREACNRDGLIVPNDSPVVWFAQYDAIFSMGERRSEIWIDLGDSHPWQSY